MATDEQFLEGMATTYTTVLATIQRLSKSIDDMQGIYLATDNFTLNKEKVQELKIAHSTLSYLQELLDDAYNDEYDSFKAIK